jgi:hypothetical protein
MPTRRKLTPLGSGPFALAGLAAFTALSTGCTDAPAPATRLDAGLDGGDSGAAGGAAGDAGRIDDAFYDPVPRTFIEDAPSPFSTATDVTLHFTSSVAFSHFECALDDAPLAPCLLRTTFEGLPEGFHRVRAVAISPTELRDPVGASVEFILDRTAPQVRIDTMPPEVTGEDTLSFDFSADERVDFTCSVDGVRLQRCTSPFVAGPLPEGVHALTVTATDRAGNRDLTPATVRWRIDRSPPDTTLTAAPPAVLTATETTFDFESPDSDAIGFECALDAAPFARCVPPVRAADLTDGPHRFAVRAFDALGLTDATPALAEFAVQVTPPETRVVSAPPARIGVPEAHFAFEPVGARFVCTLDAEAPRDCEAMYDLAGLPEGPHRLEVAAHDGAGHADPTPEVVAFTVDLTAPVVLDLLGPGSPTSAAAFEATFRAEDRPDAAAVVPTTLCALDAAAPVPCASPWAFAEVGEGEHTLSVAAEDDVGHVSEPETWVFVVDRTPPRTVVDAAPAPRSRETAGAVTFVMEPGARATCRLDDAPPEDCNEALFFADLADGEHTVELWQTDIAGNLEDPPVVVRFIVDTTPPAPRFAPDPPPLVLTPDAEIGFEATGDAWDAEITFTCAVDAEPPAPCASPTMLAGLAEGLHHINVTAADDLGNTSAPITAGFEVDAQPPAAPDAPQVFPGDGTLLVAWDAAVVPPDVDAWQILRVRANAGGDAPDEVVATVAVAAPEAAARRFHLDAERPNGQPGTYRLAAVDRHGRAGAPSPAATATPSAEGTTAPVPALPVGAPGGALLADGRVLLLAAGPDDPTTLVWSPADDALAAYPPIAPLRGAALAQLADTRLLAVGGDAPLVLDADGNPLQTGHETVQAFDLALPGWTPLAPLTGGPRTGATALVLPRGQVAIAGGTTALPPDAETWRADLYDPDFDAFSLPFPAPLESLRAGLWGAVIAGGDLLLMDDAGGLRGNLRTGAFTFSPPFPATTPGGARVLLESGRVLVAGGGDPPGTTAARFEPGNAAWSPTGELGTPRRGAALVTLPGGGVLALGGVADAPAPVERYDPITGDFTPVGALAAAHGPGDWALLLPAGDVLVAGGGPAERYRPWYFAAGPRPVIVDAPEFANRGLPFEVEADAPLGAARWVLVRLGAVSLGRDTDQRHVTLAAEPLGGGRSRLTAPADPAATAPGPHLLFALDPRGVPGEARHITLQ